MPRKTEIDIPPLGTFCTFLVRGEKDPIEGYLSDHSEALGSVTITQESGHIKHDRTFKIEHARLAGWQPHRTS